MCAVHSSLASALTSDTQALASAMAVCDITIALVKEPHDLTCLGLKIWVYKISFTNDKVNR